MKIIFLFIALLLTALFLGSCSGGGSSPDGNAVQVENGDTSLPRAEIPTEFVNATDALAEGKRLFDAGETEKAIDVLLQAVKIDPDLAEAYFNLGVAYDLVEAEDQTVDQTSEPVTESRSKKPAEKKKNSDKAFESAVTAYKKLIAKNKEDDVAHFYLGLTYNKLNEDEDAAKSLKEAVELKPDNTEYQTELGAIYIKLAKYHEAVAALKKALELDAGNIDAEELLEKAEAGRKRIDFAPPKKDEKKPGSSDANSNTNSSTGSNTKPPSGSDTNKPPKPPPTMKSTKPAFPAPARSPK